MFSAKSSLRSRRPFAKTLKLVVWAFSLNFLHDSTLFVIDIHQNVPISLILTPFDHFQIRLTFAVTSNLILEPGYLLQPPTHPLPLTHPSGGTILLYNPCSQTFIHQEQGWLRNIFIFHRNIDRNVTIDKKSKNWWWRMLNTDHVQSPPWNHNATKTQKI